MSGELNLVKDYELMVIYSPKIAEDELQGAMDRLGKTVTTHGGTVGSIELWGRKKLAYPVKHAKEGNYVLAKIKMDTKQTASLEQNLRITEEVLRHSLIFKESAPVAAEATAKG